MRFLKVLSVSLFLLALCSIAVAKDNKLGIRDVRHVSFDQAVRVGETVIPAGAYVVRHTMEGEEHIMVFQKEHSKSQVKVKCTLVALPRKAEQDQTSFELNASNERVLREIVFSGDTSKHVF
jgi:hypothetical protein